MEDTLYIIVPCEYLSVSASVCAGASLSVWGGEGHRLQGFSPRKSLIHPKCTSILADILPYRVARGQLSVPPSAIEVEVEVEATGSWTAAMIL
jgi:hypothetical protein